MTDPNDYDWTGQHKFKREAVHYTPSVVMESGGMISDSAILLNNNYVAVHDVRKTTNVGQPNQAPSTGSWGGNFGTYIQHRAEGTCGPYGTLTGAIRAQLETTQAQYPGKINDASAGYLGIYNNGVDVGGFGLHVDAYHVGTAIHGHSTYGMSAECWKQTIGGVMASYVGRAQQGEVDYGLVILHSGGSYKRGIQLGCPSYGLGGVQGAPNAPTQFAIGVDLTWGHYTTGVAMQLHSDDLLVLSGVRQDQNAQPLDVCNVHFESMTGMFAVRNGVEQRFDVNMTTGCIWQNGYPTWAGYDSSVNWAFAIDVNKTTVKRPSATPEGFVRIKINGEDMLMAYYRP